MNKKNILPELSVYSDVQLTQEEVFEWSKNIEWRTARLGMGQMSEDLKKVRDCSVKSLFEYSDKINEVVSKYLDDYAAEHEIKDLELQQYKLVRYTEGQHFAEHSDRGDLVPSRRVSMVIYLNDDYSGGELSFTKFGATIKPQANSLMLFPSTEEYSHAALPVISGVKYSLIGFWI
jgi:Rps23 Pro-64 3,4-dihydroxylase Tpa1-like proline 4-hydroxylase